MPGGKYHSPLWVPYALYGAVDHVYGWPAWESGDGFTAAQTWLNLVELVGYLAYLGVVRWYGREGEERCWLGEKTVGGRWRKRMVVRGREGGVAVVLGFGVAVLTLGKTALYWLQEGFGGWASIGHNDAWEVVWLWAVPK